MTAVLRAWTSGRGKKGREAAMQAGPAVVQPVKHCCWKREGTGVSAAAVGLVIFRSAPKKDNGICKANGTKSK